uniref:Uncharacterized protein n=1 Tax=Rhizophora mucronata TaxID=61149 RepID=A0A2P2PMV2_RHIMU
MAFKSVSDVPFKNSRLHRFPHGCCIIMTSGFLHNLMLLLSSTKHFHK